MTTITPYENLGEREKSKVLEKALALLAMRPELIKTSSHEEFVNELYKFAKGLYEKFPGIEYVQTVMIGKVTGL